MTDSNAPPKDAAPSELWAALTAFPVPHEVVDFPMRDPVMNQSIGKVAIVPLAPEDLMVCRKVAGEWASKMTGETPKVSEESPAYRDIFNDEATVQILWRALRDANDKALTKPAFPAPAVIRRKPFTADILAVLLKSYMRTCATRGPIVATMTEAEKNAWLDVLEEGGSAFPLDCLSSAMQSELLTHSAARSKSLRTGNGSHGPQPAASSSDSVTPQADKPPSPQTQDETPPSADADELPKV